MGLQRAGNIPCTRVNVVIRDVARAQHEGQHLALIWREDLRLLKAFEQRNGRLLCHRRKGQIQLRNLGTDCAANVRDLYGEASSFVAPCTSFA